jgi:hypothetical protein
MTNDKEPAVVMDTWEGLRSRLTELGDALDGAIQAFDVDGTADKVLVSSVLTSMATERS